MTAGAAAAGGDGRAGALPLYASVPRIRLPIEELGRIALERLELLAGRPRGHGGGPPESESDSEEDAVAHFALRCAFCQHRALGNWFVAREVALLKTRWEALPPAGRDATLGSMGLGLPLQLHFTEVPPHLVATRRVVLRRGIAHVQESDVGAVVAHRFEASLRGALARAAGLVGALSQSHPPLHDLLGRLRAAGEEFLAVGATPGGRAGEAASGGGGVGLAPDNFESILCESFPPCMRLLVHHQHTGRHLRHQGRLQLRPFLREAGLGLADALAWWKRELRLDPEITEEVYGQREYTYEVEHAYGQRGSMKLAFACSCAKLIDLPPTGGPRVHGCPFQRRHVTPQQLEFILALWQLPADGASAVLALAAQDQPRLACAAYFRAAHAGAPQDQRPLLHPNEYLRQSRRLRLAAQASRIGGSVAGDVARGVGGA